GVTASDAGDPRGQRCDRAGKDPQQVEGPAGDVEGSGDRDGEIVRVAGTPLHRFGPGIGRVEAAQLRDECGTGDPVHPGVVHLRDDGDPAVVETVDEPHLPQWPGAIQGLRGDVSAQLRELGPAARGGYADVVDVPVEVEVVVVDPDRMV